MVRFPEALYLVLNFVSAETRRTSPRNCLAQALDEVVVNTAIGRRSGQVQVALAKDNCRLNYVGSAFTMFQGHTRIDATPYSRDGKEMMLLILAGRSRIRWIARSIGVRSSIRALTASGQRR